MKELPAITREPVDHVELVKYAGASGDFNPIHTVPHIAKKNGFPDVIAHGMFLMGLGSKVIEDWFPNNRLKQYKVRFMAPTYPGDTLTFKGYFCNNRSEHKKGKLEIINSKGEIKLIGDFELKIKRR